MSYCRKIVDGSDVYVYPAGEPIVIVCQECTMLADEPRRPFQMHKTPDFIATSATEMILHLRKHTYQGDTVPDYAFERLEAEAKKQK